MLAASVFEVCCPSSPIRWGGTSCSTRRSIASGEATSMAAPISGRIFSHDHRYVASGGGGGRCASLLSHSGARLASLQALRSVSISPPAAGADMALDLSRHPKSSRRSRSLDHVPRRSQRSPRPHLSRPVALATAYAADSAPSLATAHNGLVLLALIARTCSTRSNRPPTSPPGESTSRITPRTDGSSIAFAIASPICYRSGGRSRRRGNQTLLTSVPVTDTMAIRSTVIEVCGGVSWRARSSMASRTRGRLGEEDYTFCVFQPEAADPSW